MSRRNTNKTSFYAVTFWEETNWIFTEKSFAYSDKNRLLSSMIGPNTRSERNEEEEDQSLKLALGQPWVWSVNGFIFLASAYEGGWSVLSLTSCLPTDSVRSAYHETDEQILRIDIDGYLSQQVFQPSLIAKYSANPLWFWEDNAVNY